MKTELSAWLRLGGILVLLMVFAVACAGPTGPAGPAGPPGPKGATGPAGPPGTPVMRSTASLAVVPPIQTVKKGTVAFYGAGLRPGQNVSLRVSGVQIMKSKADEKGVIVATKDSVPVSVLDITSVCSPVPKVNASGAFEATLMTSSFNGLTVGLYTVILVGDNEEVLATAPLRVIEAAK